MAPRKQNTPSTSTTPKPDGDKGKRERKTYAPVSLADLKPRKVTKEEKVTVLPGRERSDEQKAVDATVKDLAYDYLAAGSPKVFRDMPVVAYTLPTEQAETIKFMIQKACNLLNCKPKFGRAAWDDGQEVVTFCAIPRDPSQWTDKPVADETPAETPTETSANTDETAKTDPSTFFNE